MSEYQGLKIATGSPELLEERDLKERLDCKVASETSEVEDVSETTSLQEQTEDKEAKFLQLVEREETLEVLSQRESIRRQLASETGTGSTTNCGIFEKDSESQLTSHNLLLCFLNETPSDLEEDATEDIIDDTKVRIPPNHPLACLERSKTAADSWESQDSSSSDEDDVNPSALTEKYNRDCAATNNISHESINTSRVLVEGNISRKKGHVIIPLRRCASEAIQSVEVKRLSPPSVKNSSNQRSDNPSGANGHHDLETDFFSQLAIIQAETRRQLREAKSLAVKTVQAEKSERQIRDDIAKLLVQNPDSRHLRYNLLDDSPRPPYSSNGYSSRVTSSKLSRRILTPMNVGQLQVILNYLLTQIETLNENLVEYLITRDELAIEQDSLLTDVDDITKCIQGHDMSPF